MSLTGLRIMGAKHWPARRLRRQIVTNAFAFVNATLRFCLVPFAHQLQHFTRAHLKGRKFCLQSPSHSAADRGSTYQHLGTAEEKTKKKGYGRTFFFTTSSTFFFHVVFFRVFALCCFTRKASERLLTVSSGNVFFVTSSIYYFRHTFYTVYFFRKGFSTYRKKAVQNIITYVFCCSMKNLWVDGKMQRKIIKWITVNPITKDPIFSRTFWSRG